MSVIEITGIVKDLKTGKYLVVKNDYGENFYPLITVIEKNETSYRNSDVTVIEKLKDLGLTSDLKLVGIAGNDAEDFLDQLFLFSTNIDEQNLTDNFKLIEQDELMKLLVDDSWDEQINPEYYNKQVNDFKNVDTNFNSPKKYLDYLLNGYQVKNFNELIETI